MNRWLMVSVALATAALMFLSLAIVASGKAQELCAVWATLTGFAGVFGLIVSPFID